MNADNFLKHSSNKHNGMAKSQDVVEASQTTLHFSKVSKMSLTYICT